MSVDLEWEEVEDLVWEAIGLLMDLEIEVSFILYAGCFQPCRAKVYST